MSNVNLKKHSRRRLAIQLLWAAATNAWVTGFFTGKIYTGALKNLCVPGLNCYSCPGALLACPIGSLQAVMGSRRFSLSFYVIGLLFIFGALSGRFVCGFLCPFGLFQDLLFKIPFVKKITTFPGDWLLRKIKYMILLVFVILLPLFAVDAAGTGAPAFCKYICPQGTLQAGIPLVLTNGLTNLVGWLYAMKMSILVAVILLSVIISRPFCKYLCPLGAFYSFFNKISLLRPGSFGKKAGASDQSGESRDVGKQEETGRDAMGQDAGKADGFGQDADRQDSARQDVGKVDVFEQDIDKQDAFGQEDEKSDIFKQNKNKARTTSGKYPGGTQPGAVCPMWLEPWLTPADPECIRCGNCSKRCSGSQAI